MLMLSKQSTSIYKSLRYQKYDLQISTKLKLCFWWSAKKIETSTKQFPCSNKLQNYIMTQKQRMELECVILEFQKFILIIGQNLSKSKPQNSENSIFESITFILFCILIFNLGKNKKSVKSNLENTEEKLIVNSLKYCQKALKVFGQVKWPIGEYYCSKLEDTLKRKMKRKDITPKTVKYYM